MKVFCYMLVIEGKGHGYLLFTQRSYHREDNVYYVSENKQGNTSLHTFEEGHTHFTNAY